VLQRDSVRRSGLDLWFRELPERIVGYLVVFYWF